MDDVSPARLAALADTIGLDCSRDRAADLADSVRGFVDTTTPIPDADPTATESVESRSCWDAEDDPYDAVEYRCDVSASDPATETLADLDVGVKDAIALGGLPLECGSAVAEGLVAPEDATAVARILDAGGRITAKLALDEFAGAPYGTTGSGPPIRNPHDPTRTAGGSSGGSAAAVAAEQVDVALGTDTGGSVRIPAAFCGVVGLKPTYGLVPLTGVVENTYTLDHVGLFGRDLGDVAATLDAVAGRDPRDPASTQAAGDPAYAVGGYRRALDAAPDPSSLRIGVLAEGFGDGVTDDVAERVTDALDRIEDAGATVTTVEAPSFGSGEAVKNTLSACELAAHWQAHSATYRRGSRVNPSFQRALADRIERESAELDDTYATKLLAGAWLLDRTNGEQYTRAQAARTLLRSEFDRALADVDALALPTMPAVAPPLDSASETDVDLARNTRCANLTTHPAVSLSAGTASGLPVGLQLVGERFGEAELLAASRTVTALLAAAA